jgi:hypothetical protein
MPADNASPDDDAAAIEHYDLVEFVTRYVNIDLHDRSTDIDIPTFKQYVHDKLLEHIDPFLYGRGNFDDQLAIEHDLYDEHDGAGRPGVHSDVRQRR